MEKVRFDAEFDDFYNVCLAELKSRQDYTDAYLPMLERFVLFTMKAAKLGSQIVDEEVVVEHTNKANATNEVTSPKWRMFVVFSDKAAALAKDLKLSPITAPSQSAKKKEKKGFNLGGEMKVA